jgi:dipeptidyl aminopeptidase/acylaminoacyl peptidase
VIVDMIDAAPTPGVVVAPDRKTLALLERRSLPTVADLAQPIHRIAGQRINPKTNGRQQRTGGVYAITLQQVTGGKQTKISVPKDARLGDVSFSPDGKRLAFTNTRENGIELWVADTATGQSKLLSGTDRLNGTGGDPCDWLEDGVTLLCQLVPAGRGPAPVDPSVPTGPNIQESRGKAAPAPTYEDLIKTSHDEDLFEYYFTSQLATYDAATGKKTQYGRPGILDNPQMSPNGEHVLLTRLKRPFSRLVPMQGFPAEVEVWSHKGDTVKTLAEVPSGEGVPINGVRTGPRNYRWRPDQPATMTWVEALDEGNLKNNVPFRDKVLALQAPFKTSDPGREDRVALRRAAVHRQGHSTALRVRPRFAPQPHLDPRREHGAEKLWERRQQDAYNNPGSPVRKRGGGGGGFAGGGGRGGFGGFGEGGAILQKATSSTSRARARGRRAIGRSWTARPQDDEDAAALPRGREHLRDRDRAARRRGQDAAHRVRDAEGPAELLRARRRGGDEAAITQFKDPAPQLTGVEKQFVTYERKDGVKLSGTLYLPPATRGRAAAALDVGLSARVHRCGRRQPDHGSPNRFLTRLRLSHMFLLTQGYAIFDDPTMPIVGAGRDRQRHLRRAARRERQAAVDKVVEMGVADRDRSRSAATATAPS